MLRENLTFGKTHLKQGFLLAFILGVVLIANVWVIGKNNGFLFDDYLDILKAKYLPVKSYVHILPQMRYNDRPVRNLTFKALYGLFGINYRGYHIVLFGFHLLNTFLIYNLIRKIIKQKASSENALLFLPFLTSGIFGLWPRSIFCVQWISGIPDLLGATIALLLLNMYVMHKKNIKKQIVGSIGLVMLFYLGLRLKEMLIVLPMLFLIYDCYLHIQPMGAVREQLKSFRINILLKSLIVLMIGYFAYYWHLDAGKALITNPTSPYYYTYNPLVIATNFLRYISLYFDFSNIGFEFRDYSASSVAGLLFMLSIFFTAAWRLIYRKDFTLVLALAGFVISLAPVLPLKNMQQILYLYFPSVFLSVVLALVFTFLIEKLSLGILWKAAINFAFIGLVFSLKYSPGVKGFVDYWLTISMKNQVTVSDLKSFEKPKQGSIINVTGVKAGDNAFFYGPGAVNQIIFNDESLITVLNSEKLPPRKPFIHFAYNEETGHVEWVKTLTSNQ